MQPAGYSHRSLPDKLGIKPDMRVCLLNSPPGYQEALGAIVHHVELAEYFDAAKTYDFIHLFSTKREELVLLLPQLKAALVLTGMLWISWPKKAAKMATEMSENAIRELGLAAGLVDVKVAAIDTMWSGLKFVYRTKDR